MLIKLLIAFLTPWLLLLASCAKQNTYSAEVAKQNTVATQTRAAALQPAINTYCGEMHMLQIDEDLAVILVIQVSEDNIHATQSQDPTVMVQIPKLAGHLKFSAIENQGAAAYSTLPKLMEATGGYGAISFTEGDYNPQTHSVYLPFTVTGHTQGNYGEVKGKLGEGHFIGIWYSNSFEEVGRFDLTPCGTAS